MKQTRNGRQNRNPIRTVSGGNGMRSNAMLHACGLCRTSPRIMAFRKCRGRSGFTKLSVTDTASWRAAPASSCKALGLEVPLHLQQRADEIID
jgi:hypothetical protein